MSKKHAEEHINKLKELIGDDEAYHSVFDDLIEKRLMELDPEYMKAMDEAYSKSDMARWCA